MEKPIGYVTGGSILAFAGAIDGGVALFNTLYAIPFVGWVFGLVIAFFINFVGGIILFCWFYYLGVPFAGRMGTAAVGELIPVINTLPGWTLATAWTIMSANNVGFGQILSFVGISTGVGAVAKGVATKKVAGEAALRGAKIEAPQVIRDKSIPEGNDPMVRSAGNLKNPRFLERNENPVKREAPNDGLLVRREREQAA